MATRMQQRRGTAAQWTSADPILNAGEMGWESDTNKFKIGDGTNHWANLDYFADINSTVNPAFGSSITFEGATADSYETVLQVTDPTADRTITLPNVTGTVITTGNLSDITDIGVFTSTIVMEGSTADAYELTLSAGDPTADRTITFPDSTGTVALTSDITVTASSTNTFSNKSIALGSNTVTGTLAQFNTAVTDADFASLAGSETLTNKSISLGSNTVTSTLAQLNTAISDADVASLAGSETLTNKSISLTSNTLTGTKAEFNSAMSDADFATIAGSETLTNKTLTSPVISSITNGAATITLPSSTGTLALTTDIPAGVVTTSDSGTVTSTMIANGTITNDDINASAAIAQSKIADLTTDLAAKASLSGATFTGAVSGTDLTLSGNLTVNGTTTTIDSTTIAIQNAFVFEGATADAFETTLTLADPTADRTLTLPDATDTLVGKATTDTLTNKSISLGSNTITSTLAQLNTAVTDADLASLAGSETLTNKTLSSAIATTALTLNATAELRLADTDSSHYVGFKAPSTVSTNKIWTLPSTDGTAGYALTTDGSGTLSWAAAGGGGAAFSELMLIGA